MNKLNIRALKARGSELAGANRAHTTPIVLAYCGVLALLTLGSSGLNLYLNNQMGSTGGAPCCRLWRRSWATST